MKNPMQDFIDFVQQHCDNAGHGPKYILLSQAIEAAIRQKIVQPHDFIPAERSLAEALSLSRVTITKAIALLEEQQLVTRQQGLGTRVAQQIDYSLSDEAGFTAAIQRKGGEVSNRWLAREIVLATPLQAKQLNVNVGDRLSHLRRVRLSNGVPVSLDNTYLPERFLPDPEALEHSLYALWESRGIRPLRKTFEVRAVSCDEELAEYLEVSAGVPLLNVTQLSFGADGAVLECSESLCRSDVYAIEFET